MMKKKKARGRDPVTFLWRPNVELLSPHEVLVAVWARQPSHSAWMFPGLDKQELRAWTQSVLPGREGDTRSHAIELTRGR